MYSVITWMRMDKCQITFSRLQYNCICTSLSWLAQGQVGTEDKGITDSRQKWFFFLLFTHKTPWLYCLLCSIMLPSGVPVYYFWWEMFSIQKHRALNIQEKMLKNKLLSLKQAGHVQCVLPVHTPPDLNELPVVLCELLPLSEQSVFWYVKQRALLKFWVKTIQDLRARGSMRAWTKGQQSGSFVVI